MNDDVYLHTSMQVYFLQTHFLVETILPKEVGKFTEIIEIIYKKHWVWLQIKTSILKKVSELYVDRVDLYLSEMVR